MPTERTRGREAESIELPHSITLGRFWEGIRDGEVPELSDREIEEIIDNEYLKYNPLTELSGEEERNLREYLIHKFKEHWDFVF